MPPDSGAVSSSARTLPTCQPALVGGPREVPPGGEVEQPAFRAAQRRHKMDRAGVRAGILTGLPPQECDLLPVRRPGGEDVVRGTCREPPAFGLPDDPQPDVVVTSPLSRCRETRSGCRPVRTSLLPACRTNVSWTSRGVGRSPRRRYHRAAAAVATRTTPPDCQSSPTASRPPGRRAGRRRGLRIGLLLDLLQLDLRVEHVLEPPLRLLPEAAQDDPLQVSRNIRVRARVGGLGCSLRRAASISALELPPNGRRPVTIS